MASPLATKKITFSGDGKLLALVFGSIWLIGMVGWIAFFVIPPAHPECAFNDSVLSCSAWGRLKEGVPLVTIVALQMFILIIMPCYLVFKLVQAVFIKPRKKKVVKK